MTRSASHFCFVVFPPQSLLDVLESRVMKRTSISYCAMRDFAISAMANSTTKKRLLVSRFSIYIGWLGARGTSPDILGSKTSQCEVLSLRWQSQPNFWNSILLKIFIIITYTLYWYFCFCFQNIVISTIVGLFLLSRIKFFLWADKLLEHLSDNNLMTVPREKTSLSWLK